MKTIKKPDGWWITDIPDCGDCGPYATKPEALEIKAGLDRTFKYHNEPGFITCERNPINNTN